MVEGQTAVPYRVPDPVGDGGDLVVLAVLAVHQHEVEVAVRRGLATAVSTDCNEREASRVTVGRLLEQVGQPAVDTAREFGPQRLAGEVGLFEDGGTFGPEVLARHGGEPRSVV